MVHASSAVRRLILCTVILLGISLRADALLLIPMDDDQVDHLKAYGVVYKLLEKKTGVSWLLNFRGGSFVVESGSVDEVMIRSFGVTVSHLPIDEWAGIVETVKNGNMEKVTLEKAPRIAVYTPPSLPPWDDAVTLALTYAEIPFDKVYDREVVGGNISRYDWLHLHHEDFTGQMSKFFPAFGGAPWYVKQKTELERLAKELGFDKVSDCKKAVALGIRNYIEEGGFLFAMCTATNTLDVALSALGTDIVPAVYDGDPVDPQYKEKLDYGNCIAFENFAIATDPMAQYFDDIDVNMVNTPLRREAMDFDLFDFSAKLDPVPTMLIQNHRRTVNGFFGLCTSFNRHRLKKGIVILADVPGTEMVNYIHGVAGKGQFAFLGGHDPEDFAHQVGAPPTMLELHRNSPGYRLILNNVLFPAAEKKEKKT